MGGGKGDLRCDAIRCDAEVAGRPHLLSSLHSTKYIGPSVCTS